MSLAASDSRFVDNSIHEWDVPGVALVVIRKSETGQWTVKHHSNGDLDTKTIQPIASNSKLFTAVALGLAIDDSNGQYSWQTRVRTVLPTFQLVDPVATECCTVEDLLCHRTGLARYDHTITRDRSLDELLAVLEVVKPIHEFRARMEYMNLTYDLAAQLVEKMTGTPYIEFVTQRIFTPLGMTRSTFSFKQAQEYGHLADGFIQAGQTGHDYGVTVKVSGGPENASGTALAGCGGIFSCIEDMTKWAQVLVNKGKHWDTSEQIIPESVITEVSRGRMVAEGEASFPECSVQTYGLGSAQSSYQGINIEEHGGDFFGFASQFMRCPDQNLALVILVNQTLAGCFSRNEIKFRLLESELDLARVDWSTRLKRRFMDFQAMITAKSTFEPLPFDPIPALVEPRAIAGTYNSVAFGEWIIKEENFIASGALPPLTGQLQILPDYETHIVLSHRSGAWYDGATRYEQAGQTWHCRKMEIELDVKERDGSHVVEGFGVRGLSGASVDPFSRNGETLQERCEVYFTKFT